jgi:acyl carrier protein
MNADDIRRAVHDALAEVAPEAATSGLVPEVNFRDQFEFDSMDFVSFVIALDKRLGARTPEADYPKLSSLAGCLAYFSAHRTTPAR